MKTFKNLLLIILLSAFAGFLTANTLPPQKKLVKPIVKAIPRKTAVKSHAEAGSDEPAVKPKTTRHSTARNQSMAGLYPYNFFSPVCPNLVY